MIRSSTCPPPSVCNQLEATTTLTQGETPLSLRQACKSGVNADEKRRRESSSTRRSRIRELEQELNRKHKALAETAALLPTAIRVRLAQVYRVLKNFKKSLFIYKKTIWEILLELKRNWENPTS